MALSSVMVADTSQSKVYHGPEPLTPDQIKALRDKQKQNRGLKRFVINGTEIWAINENNAYRKYKLLK